MLQSWIRYSNSKLLFFPLYLLLVFYSTYAHVYFGDYDLSIAITGFSFLDFTNWVLFPENFHNDYPGGARFIGNSVIPWVYPLFSKIGVDVEIIHIVVVGLEIIFLTSGAMFLTVTWFKDTHPFVLLVISSLLVLSWIRASNLAMFGNPAFYGQYYGFADGLRLYAIALLFRNKYTYTAVVLCLGFMIHPLKTLFGFVFINGVYVSRLFKGVSLKTYFPFIGFILFSALWLIIWLGEGSINQIDQNEFFRFSRFLNYHWYPQDLEILTSRHSQYTTPYIAAIIISLSVLIRCELSIEIKKQVFAGLFVTILLSILGLVIAWYEISPTLIKASLQRASVLVLSIATILIVSQLFSDIKKYKTFFIALAVFILVAAFLGKNVWPILSAQIYLIFTLTSSENTNSPKFIKYSAWMLLSLSLVYEIWLWFHEFQDFSFWIKQTLWLILSLFFVFALNGIERIRISTEKILMIFILMGTIIGCEYWASKNRRLTPNFIEWGKAYKEVQLWAKQSTPNNALFLLDPCFAYGWRDYSIRSSFGSIHEWYSTGWLYNGDKAAFDEGIERGKMLGLDLKKLIHKDKNLYVSEVKKIICPIARKNYYEASGETVKKISNKYDIQYVVFHKFQAEKYGSIPDWEKVFENSHYTVVVPPENININE